MRLVRHSFIRACRGDLPRVKGQHPLLIGIASLCVGGGPGRLLAEVAEACLRPAEGASLVPAEAAPQSAGTRLGGAAGSISGAGNPSGVGGAMGVGETSAVGAGEGDGS